MEEPRIDHLHSVRALLRTVQTLESHANHPSYQKLVESELVFLNSQNQKYAEAVTKYVSQGGLLTGEAIANVYFAAEWLKISPEWLDQYVHHDVPLKYKFMSRQNLQDVVAGLEKYHKSSPYLSQLKSELSSRPLESPVYVEHQFNESNRYDYAEGNDSNHSLVSTINSGSGVWKYYLKEAWRRFSSRGQYALHSD